MQLLLQGQQLASHCSIDSANQGPGSAPAVMVTCPSFRPAEMPALPYQCNEAPGVCTSEGVTWSHVDSLSAHEPREPCVITRLLVCMALT